MKTCKICNCTTNYSCGLKYKILNNLECRFSLELPNMPNRNICICCDNKIPSLELQALKEEAHLHNIPLDLLLKLKEYESNLIPK